jgi:hypothetical protein
MSVIKFQTNIPVGLRMRSTEGRPVESQFGGMQAMFSAEEGAFYVSETVGAILAEQFQKLGVKAGEPVEITKAEVSRGGGRKGIQWMVAKVGFAPGEQPDGTFAVPKAEPSELERKLAESIGMVEARKQTASPALGRIPGSTIERAHRRLQPGPDARFEVPQRSRRRRPLDLFEHFHQRHQEQRRAQCSLTRP